jgi:hypothetical protein
MEIPFSANRPLDSRDTVYTVINDEGEARIYSADILRRLSKQEERELRLKKIGI